MSDLTNMTVRIGAYANGVGSTPGLYPKRNHPGLTGPLTGGQFALTHEGGSAGVADASRRIGTLKAGESIAVYWLVSYPLMDVNKVPVFGSGPDSSDDLWLNYDIWATGLQNGSALTAVQTNRATMRNEISAMANKIFPNTANQVPQQYQDMLNQYAPAWTNIASDGSVGTKVFAEGIWYMLGNVGAGYDCDGDLVFDHDAWLQPVGNPGLFDAGAFRLVATHTLLIVQLKTGGELVITDDDRLYFKDLPENNSVVGYVRYDFAIIQSGVTGQLTPYQEAASGSNNEKFNGDYGATIGHLGGVEGLAEFAKTASKTNAQPGETIQYSLSFTNSGTAAIGDPEVRNPVVIHDRIPAGALYLGGTAASSNTVPAGAGSYTVMFSTNNGVTWQETEPAVPSTVTDIQWWLNGVFDPATAGIAKFSVQVANPYPAGPLLVNTAGMSIGDNPPFLSDEVTTLVRGNNQLGDLIFADDGAGGGVLGNRVQDGGEAGLSNVLVTLYYDSNSNGVADAGDLTVMTTRSASNGTYLFTNVFDGAYVAKVDAWDANLPLGYTLTTTGSYSVALDTARTNTNSVSVLTADFGFAPALSLTKTPVGAGPVYEGRLVSYSLALTNNLQGDGAGGGLPVTYTVWATNLDLTRTTTGWLNNTNALGTNGLYSTDLFGSAPNDYLDVTDFRLGPAAGAITNVKVIVPIEVVTPWRAGDIFSVTLITSAGVEFFRTNYVGAASVSTGTLELDVTTNRAWSWADFNTNSVIIQLVATKGGGTAQGGKIGVDAAGFKVTSTSTTGGGGGSTTLNPVPLKDVYDTGLLQYVSASVSPSSVTTNGTVGTIFWSNVGPLYPGGLKTVNVTFKALQPPNNTAGIVTNTAAITNAFFLSGLPANRVESLAVTNLLPTGVIGDTLWRDDNRNGQQETNEFGIPNVQVVLRPPTNVNIGAGMGVSLTNTTDRNGSYLFEGIADTGRYVVVVLANSLPNGGAGATNTWAEMSGLGSSTNLTVVTNLFPASTTGGDVHRTADFGYFWPGSTINGLVWNDLNRSGTTVADGGEYGFTNVTVYLYNATNGAVAIATNRTDSTGYYSFTGSYSGSYYVAVATNSGSLGGKTWQQTFDTDGLATTGRVTVTVASGGTAYADFSYYQTGPYDIGDTLFFDWNGNGTKDAADEGIPNIPVSLYRDINSNGVIDAGVDVLVAATNSNAQGVYLFGNNPPGSFLVQVNQSAAAFPRLYLVTADPYGAKDGIGLATLVNASNTNQDFGYQPYGSGSIGDTVWRDLDADGALDGSQESGITNAAVRLYADMNGDGAYVLLAVTNTDASGMYLFSDLPDGAYKVSVDAAGAAIPKDVFGTAYVPTTATNASVTIGGGVPFLDADFGFAALGAIGDTIFWDYNASGSQDWTEPGITGVTVTLYRDANTNGLYDDGTDAFVSSRTTGSNGSYLFTALNPGSYMIVVATNSAPIAASKLTAAPALDGAPLTNSALQAQYSQYAVRVDPGTSFMGADFGFQPPGVLGKMVWLDSNGNGLREAGEQGLANVALVLSNAVTAVTNRTDYDGYYSFGGMADGTWWVRVLTNDSSFPAGLNPTYDPDGTGSSNLVSSIVVSNGHVVSVGGTARTNFDLSIDFGYQYSGANALSGTVGLDGFPRDGVLGLAASGVSTDEVAFAGVTLYLNVWRDANTNGVVDSGETVLMGSTQTAANGDYAFTSLPDRIGSGTNYYIVSLSAPREHLLLTTTNGSTPAWRLVPTANLQGDVLSVYQVVPVAAAVTNIDFAFRDLWAYDFGDLPSSYGTLLSEAGPQHRVPTVPDLYLGSNVGTEANGQPSATATLDSFDDGVQHSGIWQNGASSGTVQVRVGLGSGWLAGYVDFNRNGVFTDSGELVVNQAVSSTGGTAGVYSFSVTPPANSVLAATTTSFYARFRLFPEEPAFPAFAFAGSADDGEVEDYRWDLGALGDTVWVDANRNGLRDAGEAPLAGVRVFVDLNSNGVWNAAEPSGLTDAGGVYGIGGFPAGSFRIAVDTSSLPAGLVAVFDADATADGRTDVSLAVGQVNTGTDFGYAYPQAAVQLVKTAGGAADGAVLYAPAGSNVAYRYRVTNAGEGHLVDLVVTDDKLGAVGTVAGPLAPGASFDLYATNLNVLAPVTNIGTVAATPALADGTPIAALADVTDSDDAVVLLLTEIRGLVWKEGGGILDGIKTNDAVYAAVPVTLWTGGTGGVRVASATTDVNGAYAFSNVSTGVAYTVQFTVSKTNTLFKYFAPSEAYVVADGTNRVTIGNDAVFSGFNSNEAFAVAVIGPTQIVYGAIAYADAGLGTNDPTHTLSTAIELRLYETGGGLFVELCTVDEVAEGEPITLYIQYANGAREWIGEVISRGGSRRYLVRVDPALFAGQGAVTIIVVDESGATHILPQVSPNAFRSQLTRMTKQGLTLTWGSMPGRYYDVYRCTKLGGTWKKVVAGVLADGGTCSTIVPMAGEKQAFYKIVMQDR